MPDFAIVLRAETRRESARFKLEPRGSSLDSVPVASSTRVTYVLSAFVPGSH